MKIKFILLGVFGGIFLLSGFVAHAIKTIPLDMQKEATVVSVEKPKIVSRQFPYYPTGAKTANIEGDVEVRFDVDKNGNVQNIRISDDPIAAIFAPSVSLAMKHWRYESGKPAKDLKVVIQFRLENVKHNGFNQSH